MFKKFEWFLIFFSKFIGTYIVILNFSLDSLVIFIVYSIYYGIYVVKKSMNIFLIKILSILVFYYALKTFYVFYISKVEFIYYLIPILMISISIFIQKELDSKNYFE